MTLAAPSVYIGTELMDGHALANTPLLSGLKFTFGGEDQVEFAGPGTLAGQMLIRTPDNLDFMKVGAPIGVLSSGYTLFAGRIATLRAAPDSRLKDALVITFTAADTLADLSQYTPDVLDWYDETNTARKWSGAERRAQLAASIAPGWTLATGPGATTRDWVETRQQYWESEPWLTALDNYCRSTINRRHVTTTYVPGTGLAPRLTITGERAKSAVAEKLAKNADGTWTATATAPDNASTFLTLKAGVIGRELEWEKTPSDTITDVQLTSQGVTFGTEDGVMVGFASGTTDTKLPVTAYPGVDNTALQAAHGIKSIELTVDVLPNQLTADPLVSQIVNYWVDADTEWRPTGLEIPDSRLLSDTTVHQLLDVQRRHLAYVILTDLPGTSPIAGTRARAYVIAGEATWTGKKWVIGLTFGRVPAAPATGNYWTPERLAANPTFAATTCAQVGDSLSFADFKYIGAP